MALRVLTGLALLTLSGCDRDTQGGAAAIAELEDCPGSPLGMEHGHIKDSDITASSTFDQHSVGAHVGRARQDVKGGAWCPAQTISAGVREWLEINLHSDYRITAAETMGRYGGGQGQEFAQSYQLEYWREATQTWQLYTNTTGHQVLEANRNTYMARKQSLQPALVASKVRFLPHSKHPRTVCMRVELFGCPYTSPVQSYQVVQGDQFSPQVYLEDVYDGQEDGGILSDGLGLLTDGRVGQPLTFSQQDLLAGPGWVGWTNKKYPLEIGFVFTQLQSLQSVSIAVFNKPDMGIMIPAKLSVSYKTTRGQSQSQFSRQAKVEVLETKQTDEGITIIKYNLNNLTTRQIRLSLHFTAKWIIMSEIKFHSKPAEAEPLGDQLAVNEEPNRNVFQNEENPVRSSKVVEEEEEQEKEQQEEQEPSEGEENQVQEPNSVVPISGVGSSQMYVGITIGILSMSVLLLLFTIIFILRKNKHRIFSKHSMFLSGSGSSKGPDVAATDIRLRLSPLVYSVNTRRRISEYHDDEDQEKQTIYDEPCRPVATLKNKNIMKNKNKSCDMLCQYENFSIRDHGMVNMSNFGSTPLFNIFTVDQPGVRAPPPTSYSTTNFKDRYPAYDYSTPLRIDTHPKIAASESDVSDTFYAASDILNLKPQASNSLNWRSFIPSTVSKNDVNHY